MDRRRAAPGATGCAEAAQPPRATQAALLVVVAALLIFYAARGGPGRRRREGFASARAREVHARARQVFAVGGAGAPYSDYKKRVPGADPVQYSDVRRLFMEGSLTPYTVESVL